MRRSRTSGPRSSIAVVLFSMVVSGCAYSQVPRIDPTGQHFFVQEPVTPVVACPPGASPARVWPEDDVAVQLSPHRTVAPIGSEVVLLAGVRGGDGYLRTNRRLEWSVVPGSIGQFVAIEENSFVDWLVGDFTRPRKITNTYAIGSTQRRTERVAQRTPNPAESPVALRGQGWITVTSPIEGTSHVMVYAPDVVVCSARVQSAIIHWIDAQFGFPPPAIHPAGSRRVVTTTVLRQSNQCPHAGWIVRYEIAGGPAAGFAPSGAPAVEVATNAAGQASAEIFQKQPTHGTNQIRIQVIRPAELGGPGGERLVVGNGSTLQTWTAAALTVCTSGPATAAVGASLTYRTEVCNSGDLPAREVVAVNEMPDGLAFVSATPTPTVNGKRLEWRLGDVGARQRQVLQVNFRAVQSGSVANCTEVTAAGGIRANHCATTTILSPTLDVQVTGPGQVAVGGQATFQILITNRSQVTAAGLIIKDRFGDGLEHAVAKSPIERTLGDLAAGQSRRVDVTFRATRAGQLCHTVEIVGADGVRAGSQGCVTATGVAVAPPSRPSEPVAPPPSRPSEPVVVQPPPATQPTMASSLAVKKTGPRQATVGQIVDFVSEITNISTQALTNVRVSEEADAALAPEKATEGYQVEGTSLVWTIPSLPPGTTAQVKIQYRCNKAGAQVCNHVVASVTGGGRAEDQVCLEILAAATPTPTKVEVAPDGLAMTVTDLQNPVTAGNGVTYLVRVTNKTATPDGQVTVTATVPTGTVVDRLGTSGAAATTYSSDSKTIKFTPVPDLRPGETLTYRIRVQTSQPGQIRMRVEATSRSQSKPLVVEKTTDVNPAR